MTIVLPLLKGLRLLRVGFHHTEDVAFTLGGLQSRKKVRLDPKPYKP